MKPLFASLVAVLMFAHAAGAQEKPAQEKPGQEKPAQIVRSLSHSPLGGRVNLNQIYHGDKPAEFGDGPFGFGKGGNPWGVKKGGAAGLTPGCPVPWSVSSTFLQGGRQEGVQQVVINNGKLQITVIPTRGMGITDVAYDFDPENKKQPKRLRWQSPVQEIINPAFMNLNARGGLGWLEGFNEFMCRCGMENVGQPGKDEIVTNTGAKAEVDLTLHGKVANIPARWVELVVDTAPPYRIRIRARVDEKMMFGTNLELHTEISTEPGSMEFRIEDKVVNKSSQPQEFQMLYHTNIGKPLLEEGARFLAPVKRVIPVNAHSAKDVKAFGDIAGPTPGIIEQAYFFHPIAGKDGDTLALLHNKTKNEGLSMRWSVKELPYLTLWKNTAAVEDGYVIGIEPGTSFPNMRRVERKAGRVPRLEGGKSHTMRIDFGVHVGEAALEPVFNRIEALQKKEKMVIEEAP
jgi:hypothetical protein